jgi:hypothetical protein
VFKARLEHLAEAFAENELQEKEEEVLSFSLRTSCQGQGQGQEVSASSIISCFGCTLQAQTK